VTVDDQFNEVKYTWSFEKFVNRFNAMKEIYQNWKFYNEVCEVFCLLFAVFCVLMVLMFILNSRSLHGISSHFSFASHIKMM